MFLGILSPLRPPCAVILAPTGGCCVTVAPGVLYALGKFLFQCLLESSGSLRLARMSLIPRCWCLKLSKLLASWSIFPVSKCGASLARVPRILDGDLFCLPRLGVGTACLGPGLSSSVYSLGHVGKDSKLCPEEFSF